MTSLSRGERFRLGAQYVLGFLFFPFLGWILVGVMRVVMNYRIVDIKALRRQFLAIARAQTARRPGGTRGAFLVCGNHLTMVDSALITWALASNWTYLRHYRWLPWNIPERSNFVHRLSLRVICYLIKSIPIERRGPFRSKRAALEKLAYVLKKGEAVSIFPEGKRSRTGRFDADNISYGVGDLLRQTPNVGVLCVYLRGRKQTVYSAVPAWGDQFDVKLDFFVPQTDGRGLRASRDLTRQVAHRIATLEKHHFADLTASSSGPRHASLHR